MAPDLIGDPGCFSSFRCWCSLDNLNKQDSVSLAGNTNNGEKGLRPCLGMELIKESQMPITWKIIGISPPIFKDMLENEMRMYYDSDVIWDCLLMPVDHSQSLSVGESLVFE